MSLNQRPFTCDALADRKVALLNMCLFDFVRNVVRKVRNHHRRLAQVPTSSWETDADADAAADGLLGGKAPAIGPDPAIIGVTRQSGSKLNTVLTPHGSSG